MVTFVGEHTGVFDVPLFSVFRTATDVGRLDRWVIGTLENPRLLEGDMLAPGALFSADAALALSVHEMDRIYQVTQYDAPFVFAWRCVEGPAATGVLRLERTQHGTRISWTRSTSTSNFIDHVAGVLTHRHTQRRTDETARREVERLVDLANEPAEPDGHHRSTMTATAEADERPARRSEQRTTSMFDDRAAHLLAAADAEAYELGDVQLRGHHLLLAMTLREDGTWEALRWSGASALTLEVEALRAATEASPRHNRASAWEEVRPLSAASVRKAAYTTVFRALGEPPADTAPLPFAPEVRDALHQGWAHAGEHPLTPVAVLAALARYSEPAVVEVLSAVNLLPEDVLGAVAILSRLEKGDAVAEHLATGEVSHDVSSGGHQPTRPVEVTRQKADQPVAPAAYRWADPDRESALIMCQFQLVVASLPYLASLATALCLLVGEAARSGRWWLLLLTPLLALGNPATGSWVLAAVAALFAAIGLPLLALVTIALFATDTLRGSMMSRGNEIRRHPPRGSTDVRLGSRHVTRALVTGSRTT
jgi:hypothetical protein